MTYQSFDVTISWADCDRTTFACSYSRTVLAEALGRDIDLPFACRWGACARCLTLFESGDIAYEDRPRILAKFGRGSYPTASARESRYALLCLARPRADCLFRFVDGLVDELAAGSDEREPG